MNLEEQIRQEREAFEQLDLSDELREEVSSILDHIDAKMFYWMEHKSEFIKIVRSVVENTNSLEALCSVRETLDCFGLRGDFEEFFPVLHNVTHYGDGKLVSSVADVLRITDNMALDHSKSVRKVLRTLSCEENKFSREYIEDVTETIKYLKEKDQNIVISHYSNVINEMLSKNLINCHNDLKILINFFKSTLEWKNNFNIFEKVKLTYPLFSSPVYKDAKNSFFKILDMYKDDQELINEICVKNFRYRSGETSFRKGERLKKFFAAITLPEISYILKSDEVKENIPALFSIIRETCFLIFPKNKYGVNDFDIVKSITEKAYDYTMKGKDLYPLRKQVDYALKNGVSVKNFKHLTDVIDQTKGMNKDEIENFLYFNGKIVANIDNKELCNNLSERSKKNLLNAYQSVFKVSQKWRGKYRSSAREAFFTTLNHKVSSGNNLFEKEMILNEYSSNVVRLIDEKIIDLTYMQEVAA
jgi:hypothetical protein